MWRKGTLVTVGRKAKPMVQPLKQPRRFLRKLKTELPYVPAIPLPGIYPKEMKTGS